VVHEVVVVHDPPAEAEHGAERRLGAARHAPAVLLARRLVLFALFRLRVRIGVRDVPAAHALEEAREAQVVPRARAPAALTFPARVRVRLRVSLPLRIRPVRARGEREERRERGVERGEHPRAQNGRGRVRRREEEVAEFEQREEQPAALLQALARLARDEFLRGPMASVLRERS
jgi:hypothetical protein